MSMSDHYVTVHVSTELLAELREWSQPVQVKILQAPGAGTGYEMIARTIGPPPMTEDQANALDAMRLGTKGVEYSEQTTLSGGPFGGEAVKTNPEHDHLYIQDREARWVYIKRGAFSTESSDPGRAQYDFARREPIW